ncbi:MAG: hypothetical protein LBG61_06435 [Burkholderiales bacterium]|jgi:hypothetical protein|nr:hypothetical protein [Burkholderiales bacterium]
MAMSNNSVIEFKADRHVLLQLGFGVVSLLICLADRSSVYIIGLAFVGVSSIVVGLWKKFVYFVRLYEDHFETKLAPIAGWHSVLYSEVLSATATPKDLTLTIQQHHSPEASASKQIKIRLTELSDDDKTRLLEEFKNRLPNPIEGSI